MLLWEDHCIVFIGCLGLYYYCVEYLSVCKLSPAWYIGGHEKEVKKRTYVCTEYT